MCEANTEIIIFIPATYATVLIELQCYLHTKTNTT